MPGCWATWHAAGRIGELNSSGRYRTLGGRFDYLTNRFNAEGFAQNWVTRGLEKDLGGFSGGIPSYENHFFRKNRIVLAQQAVKLLAVHAGHPKVGDNNVEFSCRDQAPGLFASRRLQYVMALGR